MSCVCKVFHIMIAKRLEWFVEKNKILSPFTYGFRRGQSCLDCLTRLVSHIQIGFSKNIPTVACFIDIENAYNNVSVYESVKILNELEISAKICKYL